MSADEEFVQSYLKKGPPYPGDSNFKDKAQVKDNGGRWNGELKKWEARSEEDLAKLIGSGLWVPCGWTKDYARNILSALHNNKRKSDDGVDEMYFDRRNPKRSKFNHNTDVVKYNGHTRVYARECSECGILLDSRLQFGLECDCHDGSCWKACMNCSKPIRLGEECGCPPANMKS